MYDHFLRAGLHSRKTAYLLLCTLSTFPVWIVLSLVRIYQVFISPLKQLFFGAGCGCRFQPSCSCYAYSAFLQYGFWKGFRLTLWRVLRCHPWHPGGFDPLPDTDLKDRGTAI